MVTFILSPDYVEPEFSALVRTIPEFVSDGTLIPLTSDDGIRSLEARIVNLENAEQARIWDDMGDDL